MPESLDTRRRVLEDAFFIDRETQLKRRLEQERLQQTEREAIVNATGIIDPAVIDQLIELDLSGSTLAALALVPLVVVAWADGGVGENERVVALSVAEDLGFEPGSASYDLLDEWLLHRPPSTLLSAWQAYTAAFIGKLDQAGRDALRREVMGRAQAIAEAQGGFLTFGRISAAEQAMLKQIEITLA